MEALQVIFAQGGAILLLFIPKINAIREGISEPETTKQSTSDGISHILKRASNKHRLDSSTATDE